jgi:hypothetical protein
VRFVHSHQSESPSTPPAIYSPRRSFIAIYSPRRGNIQVCTHRRL